MADRSIWDLGDYLDEVDRQANAFDVFVRQLEDHDGQDTCGHGFFGGWNAFINQPAPELSDTGKPLGWRAFYVEHRGFLDRLLTDEPLWIQTENYEEEIIRYYDMAIACGASPPMSRPTPAHQPPPPSETTEGQIATGLKWAAAIGLVAAIGYALRGIPRGGGNGGA